MNISKKFPKTPSQPLIKKKSAIYNSNPTEKHRL